jgi:hypothetical protein
MSAWNTLFARISGTAEPFHVRLPPGVETVSKQEDATRWSLDVDHDTLWIIHHEPHGPT